MRSCTWDCSSTRVTGTRLFRRDSLAFGGAVVAASDPDDLDSLCRITYCVHPDHHARGPLPPCIHDASEGAVVEWGAECSLTATLF